MNLADHLAVVVISLGLSIYNFTSYKPALFDRDPGARIREYMQTIGVFWILTFGVVWIWFQNDRVVSGLGLAIKWDTLFFIGLAIVVLLAVFFRFQARTVRTNPDLHEAVRQQFGESLVYLPTNRRELRWFRGVSISAGICEEILYRGYLLWYFTSLAGVVVAVAASSVIFGLAHLNFGISAAIRSGVTGLVFAGIYLLTDSLWIPIFMHILVDWNGGTAAVALGLVNESATDAQDSTSGG